MEKQKANITQDELDVEFILSKIDKCCVTETKVRESKRLDVYRSLTPATIVILETIDGIKVKTFEKPVDGVYHTVSWKD